MFVVLKEKMCSLTNIEWIHLSCCVCKRFVHVSNMENNYGILY